MFVYIKYKTKTVSIFKIIYSPIIKVLLGQEYILIIPLQYISYNLIQHWNLELLKLQNVNFHLTKLMCFADFI